MLNSTGFNQWADAYDESVRMSDEDNSYPFAGYRRVMGAVFASVRETPGRRVLDLGIGTGVLSSRLYDVGCAITGVDFSEEMLTRTRQRMPMARLIHGDLTRGLPACLAGETFDAIVCTYAIHHLTEAQQTSLIRQCLPLLTPGGRLLIGDVAFENRKKLEQCRIDSGESWDDDEHYPVAETLQHDFPTLRFTKASFCAGVLTLEA